MPIPRSGKDPRDRHAADFEVVRTSSDRSSTISVALPSSILSNAQSPELRIYLAGQIARSLAIYSINEVVIFKEHDQEPIHLERHEMKRRRRDSSDFNPTEFFKLILEYLETPQYLRKHLFPVSPELRLVGLLNPLALPSHVSRDDYCRWREGIAVGRTNYNRGQNRRSTTTGKESAGWGLGPPTRFVEVGQEQLVEIDSNVSVGERVTIDMDPSGPKYGSCPGKYLFGRLVTRESPEMMDGLYWGYRVRVAESLSGVFSNSAVSDEGYDLTIGTSERGTPIKSQTDGTHLELPEFDHLLIVFGGVHGLERSVVGDRALHSLGISTTNTHDVPGHDVAELFDYYVNTCPNQGSRTIRTEEALPISIAALQPLLKPREKKVQVN